MHYTNFYLLVHSKVSGLDLRGDCGFRVMGEPVPPALALIREEEPGEDTSGQILMGDRESVEVQST